MNLPLLIAQILLLVLGLVGVANAKPGLALDHGLKALLSLAVTLGVAQLRPKVFLKGGVWVWLVSLVMLVMVLFIGVGTAESSGTRRWLDFGPLRFQPSEIAKLGLVLQLASFFARRGVYKKLLSATGMIVITTLLILVEPDLGTSVLTFALGVVVMYSAGVRITNIAAFLLGLGLLSLPFISVYLERNPYIQERLFGHTERDEVLEQGLDQIGKAHRDLTNGGLWGLGPDAPRFELFAAHTDLVISSIGFSLGFVGVAAVLFAYWLIVAASLKIAQQASKVRPLSPSVHGSAVLAVGCMFLIVGQAMINLAVAVGFFPVTGVPLPLVSYGFSSMLVMGAALGIIHSAQREVNRGLAQMERAARRPVPQPAAAPAPAVAPAEAAAEPLEEAVMAPAEEPAAPAQPVGQPTTS
ncbi:FtsW/RodA/SpoVE family cell cycle protein [Deinococcus sp. Marseille-Q6407]|uniref:FtsW/RodA/SpoVE family cell cycle protein n=1 Tax=Deinococcus sp. Marseille-Q6407 TaxID=2969223 RepID=UPI0021C0D940|nr:FtsW/RodA/SpoVE family cell cycle protein [Deinococcus sp. Marseille-Q6407]